MEKIVVDKEKLYGFSDKKDEGSINKPEANMFSETKLYHTGELTKTNITFKRLNGIFWVGFVENTPNQYIEEHLAKVRELTNQFFVDAGYSVLYYPDMGGLDRTRFEVLPFLSYPYV